VVDAGAVGVIDASKFGKEEKDTFSFHNDIKKI